jgi:hypothetical protein
VTADLRHAFRQQARACEGLGSPFMARLCRLLSDRLAPAGPLGARLFGWAGDVGPNGGSVPLRLCGALHALVLRGHPGLAAVYPPQVAGAGAAAAAGPRAFEGASERAFESPFPRGSRGLPVDAGTDDDAMWFAVAGALETEAAFIDAFLNTAPQTNEVRRSAALIAAGHWLAARHGLPLVLSELGASAGLNTIWDRYALARPGLRLGPADAALTLAPDWTGRLPPAATVTVADRAAVDLNPIDTADPAQRLRLLAYLWADQPERRALTEAALAAGPPLPDRGDAADWLAARLATPRPGHLHLIFHTIAWQYFPAPVQARARGLIEAVGARATPDAPLAWLAYEADGATPGAGVTLRLWPGDVTVALGRADFHGRWVDWRAP